MNLRLMGVVSLFLWLPSAVFAHSIATLYQKQTLKTWNLPDLQKLKTRNSKERDPHSGEVLKWSGPLLSDVVEQTLSSLPPEQRAQIDLVILKNSSGVQALIPKYFIVKFPVLLATDREKGGLKDWGPVGSVIPWSSQPKILSEALPLERYFLAAVSEIEFTSYSERFPTLYLKRRTDPSAMRGEKIFRQSCVNCHAVGPGPSVQDISSESHAKTFETKGHSVVKGNPKLSNEDRHSLISYFQAYRQENVTDQSSASRGGLPQAQAAQH